MDYSYRSNEKSQQSPSKLLGTVMNIIYHQNLFNNVLDIIKFLIENTDKDFAHFNLYLSWLKAKSIFICYGPKDDEEYLDDMVDKLDKHRKNSNIKQQVVFFSLKDNYYHYMKKKEADEIAAGVVVTAATPNQINDTNPRVSLKRKAIQLTFEDDDN